MLKDLERTACTMARRPSSTSSLLTGDRLNALVDDARARGLTVTDRLDRLAVETGSKSDE